MTTQRIVQCDLAECDAKTDLEQERSDWWSATIVPPDGWSDEIDACSITHLQLAFTAKVEKMQLALRQRSITLPRAGDED